MLRVMAPLAWLSRFVTLIGPQLKQKLISRSANDSIRTHNSRVIVGLMLNIALLALLSCRKKVAIYPTTSIE